MRKNGNDFFLSTEKAAQRIENQHTVRTCTDAHTGIAHNARLAAGVRVRDGTLAQGGRTAEQNTC